MSLLFFPQLLTTTSSGVAVDAVSGIQFSRSGGSNLTGAAKRRNDFPIFPNTRCWGIRTVTSSSNILYALDSNNTSFENGVGSWTTSNCSISSEYVDPPLHGEKALVITTTGSNANITMEITSNTTNTTYTAHCFVRALNPQALDKTFQLQLIGNNSGTTTYTINLGYRWTHLYCSKTFSGDSTRQLRVSLPSSSPGDSIAIDAMGLFLTSPSFNFEEGSNTTATCSFILPPFKEYRYPITFLVFDFIYHNSPDTNTLFSCDTVRFFCTINSRCASFLSTEGGKGISFYAPTRRTHVYAISISQKDIQGHNIINKGYITKPIGQGAGRLNIPFGIARDSNGNFYISNTKGHYISKYDSSFNYITSFGTYGSNPGQFNNPNGICVTSSHLFVADLFNYRIQKFNLLDLSFAGSVGSYGSDNDRFNNPRGICTDGTYIYITDSYNHRIIKRRCDDLTYVAQIGSLGGGNDQFRYPFGIDTDGTYLYIADSYNHRIKVHRCDDLSYVAKVGSFGSDNYQFRYPRAIKYYDGLLYIGDYMNGRICVYNSSNLNLVDIISFPPNVPIGRLSDFYIDSAYIYGVSFDTNSVELYDRTTKKLLGFLPAPYDTGDFHLSGSITLLTSQYGMQNIFMLQGEMSAERCRDLAEGAIKTLPAMNVLDWTADYVLDMCVVNGAVNNRFGI